MSATTHERRATWLPSWQRDEPDPAGARTEETHPLPPGPRLPSAVQTLLLWRYTPKFLRACEARYGPTFTVRDAAMGTLVYLTDPDDLKTVFTGDAATYHAGEGNSILAPVMGERSVLILDEDEHLEQRKRMLPAFHGESVRRYGETMASLSEEEIDRWPVGEPFAVHPRMQALTLEVILHVVIGVDAEERRRQLRELLPTVVDLNLTLALMWLRPQLGRFGPWRRYHRTLAAADELLYAEIRERRADSGLDARGDVLSLLIRAADEAGKPATDEELRDQLVTLLLAGHETTATALAWCLERLARHPAVLARLVRELDAGDDAYLEAVVKETLRVRPVIYDVVRKLKAPVELSWGRLPAGVSVLPSIGLVQRDPARHADPSAFRPERFLEGEEELPYSWIPFGGGRRRCIGAAFATFEMKTVLRTMLSRLELETTSEPGERVKLKHITLTPARGGRLSFRPRAPVSEP